jgi:diacylglycerol O-acyltransferase
MTNAKSGDRLSWGDALFLYLERAGMPLNIASVSTFEGAISLEECIRSIRSKLPLLPRYRQRIVTPPLNIGFPSWESDPEFELRNHIHEVILRRGTESELRAAAGKVLGTVMGRQHPLWDLTVVRGLRGDRTAIVTRAHHCLADGIAGVGLMTVLMDPDPESPPAARRRPRRRPVHQDSWTRFLDGSISSFSDLVQRILTGQAELVNFSERLLAAGDWPMDEFARFLPELAAPTERLFFNLTYQGPQKFAWARIPLPDIKAVRERCGATHNDVVLAIMTATIQRYAELHGDRVKGRLLRMMVPVSFRASDRAEELGNCISLLPVTVPLGIRSPRRLLAAVHERMDFLKRAHIAELVGLAGGLIGATPPPLQALVGPLASLLPVTPFNLVCTNVRGPQAPLYFLGHKMLDWYPYVPVGGEMALNCAILTYNDSTYFGFSGDAHAAPDLQRLEGLLTLSFAELVKAAGLRPRPRMNSRRSRRPLSVRPVLETRPSPASARTNGAGLVTGTTGKDQQPSVAFAAD